MWTDETACEALEAGGWKYDWNYHCWSRTPWRQPSEHEIDAATYLRDEWDYGTFEWPEKPLKVRATHKVDRRQP